MQVDENIIAAFLWYGTITEMLLHGKQHSTTTTEELQSPLKMIGKGFVLLKINSSPNAFYIIKPTCISWLVFKVSKYLKKIIENCEPEGLFTLPSDDVISWQNPNIQLVCAKSAVKFNIWDVVSVILSLIIMSSDEIDSLGLFVVGFKTLQSYIMSVWHQISIARIQPVR